MCTHTEKPHERDEVSRRIWEASYIHSLESMDATTARQVAENAVHIYLTRWTFHVQRSSDRVIGFQTVYESEQGLR